MIKKLLSKLLTFVLVLGLLPVTGVAAESTNSGFTDMPDNWATEALVYSVEKGWLNGYTDGTIKPESPLTRAEMATIVVRAFGYTEEGDLSGYTDVKEGWYRSSIAKASKMGVLKGYAGLMRPDDNIRREEAFAVLARALKLEPAKEMTKIFEDSGDISDWAKGEIYALVKDGYIQGYNGKLNPLANIKRSEFAQVMFNLKDQIAETPVIPDVVAVSAINSTTLEVTLSDGSTVMQTLDTPLEKNVPTEVTVKYDGEEYKFNVIWTPNTAEDLEGQIEDAKQAVKDLKEEQSEAKIAVQDANAKKKAAESALSYLEGLNLDEDNPRLVKAQEALDQAEAERVKANEELGKINKAVKEAEDDVTELEKELHQAKAIEAVEKAEETRTAEDIAAARKLVPNASGAELRAKLEGRLSDVEAINTAVVEAETAIKAIPAKITTNSNGLIGKARAAVKKATDLGATEDEIEGMDKLVAAEAKLAELQAEKKATDLVNNSVANFKAGNYDTAESQHDEALPLVNALTNKNLQKDLLAKLDTVKKGLEDIAAAAAVDELILAIHSSDHTLVTEDDREDVEAVRTAFDNLTKDQQALVKYESHLKGLEGHLAKLEAASEVEALLLALPKADDVDYNDKDQIVKAREEYDKLEADVKAVITEEAYNKFMEAEVALKVIEDMKATVATGVDDAGRFMEVKFEGFTVSDVKSLEAALFFGDTEQVSLTAKPRLAADYPDADTISGNFKKLDENYWIREGKIEEGLRAPNVIKATIELNNGRTIELEEAIK